MLPLSYQLPAAVLFVLGGALSCFAGYRLFRLVLGIYGFIAGAALASSTVAAPNTAGIIVAAILGGLLGSVILVLAYFVGIALVGAGAGALVMHVVWSRIATDDPPWIAVVILSIIGAIGAMLLQRFVIIVSTAFGGAWTIIVGGLAIAGHRDVSAPAPAGDVWIVYPFTHPPPEAWVPIAWVLLGLIGTAVQMGFTARDRAR